MKHLFKVTARMKQHETCVYYLQQSTLNTNDMKRQIIKFLNKFYSTKGFNGQVVELLKIELLNPKNKRDPKDGQHHFIE